METTGIIGSIGQYRAMQRFNGKENENYYNGFI